MFQFRRIPLYLLSFVCLTIGLFASCNEIDPKNENDVRSFLADWNQRHTELKSMSLKHEYMDVLVYYGTELTKEQVQQHKSSLFKSFPDYKQEIDQSSIRIERVEADYIISFIRNITYGEQTVSVASFLNVSAKNSEFRILREGIAQGNSNTDLEVLFPTGSTLEANFGERRKLYGDFNGDSNADYAWIVAPNVPNGTATAERANCSEGCDRTVMFSNEALEPWIVEDVYTTSLVNLTDLNRDGADEVGLWSKQPNAETLYVWDALNNKLLTEPLTINTQVHKNLKLIDVLKKSGVKKITVTESAQENGVWILKSRVVVLD